MKNRTWVLLYILVLVLIVFFEYKKDDTTLTQNANMHYKLEKNQELDSFLLSYVKTVENNVTLNKLWKIISKGRKSTKVKAYNGISIEVILKKRTLCIQKECFKLLGIFQESKDNYASFYNAKSKDRVKEYLVGEALYRSIKIKSIVKQSITLFDTNSTREWKMQLFDVNISQYKPKEFE